MRLNKKISPLDNLIYTHYRITHALRITLAFILTFLIIRLLAIPEGTWPLITLVVVMGPISYWGNVLTRAMQRIGGTVFGAISGLIALYLESYSLTLMLVWCGVVMFLCGYLTLGKRPYMALLIGITLAVVWICSWRYDYRPVAQRRCYFWFIIGIGLYQCLSTTRFHPLAYADE